MQLFDGFGKKFTSAAKAVGRRTQDAAEVVKLNSRVSSIQDEINRLFTQVGKAYFAVRSSGQNEAAEKLCLEIERLQAEQRAVRDELDAIRNVKRCTNCGDVQPLSAAFCAGCGTRMPEAPKPAQPVEPELNDEAAPDDEALQSEQYEPQGDAFFETAASDEEEQPAFGDDALQADQPAEDDEV